MPSNRFVTAMLLAGIALLGPGCGDQPSSVSAPVGTSSTGSDPQFLTSSSLLGGLGLLPECRTLASRYLYPGTAATVSGGRYTLQVAAGSLPYPARIEISECSGLLLTFELEPHGIRFNEPVTLVVDYRGTNADPNSSNYDGSRPILLWLNPLTLLWELVPGADDPAKLTYTARLWHFSRYAMATGGTAEW